MSKVKKTWLIVGISILSVLAVGGVIFWLLYPELVAQWANVAWKWLNEPLPVVGVSVLIMGMFIIKLASMTSWGKTQVSKIKATYEEYKTQIGGELSMSKEKVDSLVEELKAKQAEINYLKSKLVELCSTIKNKRVNELGKEIEHEETIDNDTKEE